MALNEIKKNIVGGIYSDLEAFIDEVNLIWQNAVEFNGETSLYASAALEASEWFNRKVKVLPSTPEEEWLRKAQKISHLLTQAIQNPPSELRKPNAHI